LASDNLADYRSIADRNLFGVGGSGDEADFAYLTAVIEVNGEPEAWFTLRASGKLLKLRRQQSFDIGSFHGIVADISGELGEYATPSPPGIPTLPAIDLIDDSCLYVSAPIDEVDASVVKVGQPGRITLDAIKGKQFPGKVTRIAPYVIELEKQARTVEVEVEFTELPKEENLLVGYSADIEIVHMVKEHVLRIPTQNLMEGKKVLLYKADGSPDGRLEERNVVTGLANWQYTEIVSGLKQGDQIVASLDRAGVKAGAKVRPEASSQDGAKPAP